MFGERKAYLPVHWHRVTFIRNLPNWHSATGQIKRPSNERRWKLVRERQAVRNSDMPLESILRTKRAVMCFLLHRELLSKKWNSTSSCDTKALKVGKLCSYFELNLSYLNYRNRINTTNINLQT